MEKIIFDYTNGEISINDKIIRLTYRENELMRLLIKNQDKYVSKEEIIKIIYKDDYNVYGDYSIGVLIARLKAKISPVFEIKNKYKFGYKLVKIDSKEKQGEEVYEI